MTDRPPQEIRPGLRVMFVSLFGTWGAILLLITVSSLPYNPSSVDVLTERDVKVTVPEGWGFFTRNPREPDIALFEERDGIWRKAAHMPIASSSNLFGIDRLPRAQSVEIGMILNDLDEQDAWRPCDADLNRCLKTAPVVSLRNHWKYPVLLGSFGFVRQEPVPWAWAKSRDRITMPRSVIVTRVR